MADQDKVYSGTPPVVKASACPPAHLWVWRMAVALVLGGLLGVYQPQQPALLPDGVLSGGVLALAVLASLALDRRVPHKSLILPGAASPHPLGIAKRPPGAAEDIEHKSIVTPLWGSVVAWTRRIWLGFQPFARARPRSCWALAPAECHEIMRVHPHRPVTATSRTTTLPG